MASGVTAAFKVIFDQDIKWEIEIKKQWYLWLSLSAQGLALNVLCTHV